MQFVADAEYFAHDYNKQTAVRFAESIVARAMENGRTRCTDKEYAQFCEWERPFPRRERSRIIPARIRRAVFARDGKKCRECGVAERLSLDHIVPFVQGGKHTMQNLRVLCVFCNSRKGARVHRAEDS